MVGKEMKRPGQRGEPWFRIRGALEPYRCRECGLLHCFWCGGPFVTDRRALHDAAPSREHLREVPYRRYPLPGLPRSGGPTAPSGAIVAAHQACNRFRGTMNVWVPFHRQRPDDPLPHQQRWARDRVRLATERHPQLTGGPA